MQYTHPQSETVQMTGVLRSNKDDMYIPISSWFLFREERYQCAVTGDVLNNSTHCAVLKTTGHVVTQEQDFYFFGQSLNFI